MVSALELACDELTRLWEAQVPTTQPGVAFHAARSAIDLGTHRAFFIAHQKCGEIREFGQDGVVEHEDEITATINLILPQTFEAARNLVGETTRTLLLATAGFSAWPSGVQAVKITQIETDYDETAITMSVDLTVLLQEIRT